MAPAEEMPPAEEMAPAEETALREEIVATARAMSAKGLSPQRSGNVSARAGGDAILITPSGLAYETMAPGDIVRVGLDGARAPGQMKPSSETPFHLAIYRARPEAKAIVHCHSPAATTLACARRAIPAFHYMVAAAGGSDIRCAPYATFGTEELAENTVKALQGRRACLLANHGQVAFGPDLGKALELAAEVETLSGEYLDLLKLGEVHVLDDEEMTRVLERFKGYGVQKAH